MSVSVQKKAPTASKGTNGLEDATGPGRRGERTRRPSTLLGPDTWALFLMMPCHFQTSVLDQYSCQSPYLLWIQISLAELAGSNVVAAQARCGCLGAGGSSAGVPMQQQEKKELGQQLEVQHQELEELKNRAKESKKRI
ncbi:hypothetical protein U9M48_041790 [Paspalum notatum var. saurae]|uniref:Uncharacterized protein n=1 Tax=Paspalum notatum var. saurae TaxID=547442 RepID=A0AAQ3XDS1_PASNO